MYYSNLYSKEYNSEYEDLSITVYILPKLAGWSIISYPECFYKCLGTDAEIIENGSTLKIVPTTPTKKDWLAVVSDIDTDLTEIDLYITEYTNSRIHIDDHLDPIVNKLYKESKKEYAELKKSEIRLYHYSKNSMWLNQQCPRAGFENYDYCRFTSCLLDKSFETPKKDGYLFGIVKKTILDRKEHLVDIITPISVYINYDPYDLNAKLDSPFDLIYEDQDEILLQILKSIVDITVDNTFFRIFYHYAKKDAKLMELYNETISKESDSSLLENTEIAKMLENYKKDVKAALKNSVDEIANIYNILSTTQPKENVGFYLSLSDSEKRGKLQASTKVLLAYNNKEFELKEVSSVDTTLCSNYDIEINENGFYYFVEKR